MHTSRYCSLLQKQGYMHSQPKARFVVPAATAILLTFGRAGMLSFQDVYTPLDQAMNIFVVLIAPLFALKDIYPRLLERRLLLFLPFLLLATWVIVCVLLGSPKENWPPETVAITISLSVLFASQISRFELRRLRHFVLLITALFSVCVLIFAQSSLSLILSGGLKTRLGVDISPSNVILFPRIMYVLVITCFVTLVMEKSIWLRICAALMMILPALIALAAAGRGPLFGLVLAAIFFTWGYRKKKGILALAVFVVLVVVVTVVVNSFLPVLQQRMIGDQDDGRGPLWEQYLSLDPTWFGRGIIEEYPHNIFMEFFFNYGIIGFVIFLAVLGISVTMLYRSYSRTHDEELLWVGALLVLQMTAQQLSLDIFQGSLWATILLPLGLARTRRHHRTRREKLHFNAASDDSGGSIRAPKSWPSASSPT